jgi:pimeloyl-ACP methyl ester carboxylesterase/DNA-binding SARP family transcriptional activator
VQVRVLGSVSICDRAGRAVADPERKAREVLALLAVSAPSAVTLDELVDLLWDTPPESAVRTIRAHLSRLRATLRLAGVDGSIERSGSASYRLVLPPGTTDVSTVEALRRRGRELRADGRADSAAAVLADARRHWRGDPEFPDTTAASAVARGWRRERRQLALEHLQCVVEGSDPSRALGELERHTASDPADEPMQVLHIRALYRSGHQTEAVRGLASARAALVELGLDPGGELLRVESEVFTGPTERAAGPGASPRPDEVAAVREPSIRYAVSDGRHVAYTVLSSGPKDIVVLNPAMITIDGMLDEPRLRRSIDRIGELGRVVCLDRQGIGLSDPLDPRRDPLDEWTADVLQVLDALEIGATHLLANFDTGLIALEFAARHPARVASLVLAHCFARYQRADGYPHGVDPATSRRLIRDTVSPAEPEHRVDTVAHVAPTVAGDDGFRRWWTRIGQRGAGPATAMAIRVLATQTDLRDRLADVDCPALVLHRRHCVNVGIEHARYLADHLPNAELAMVPGSDSLWFTDTPHLLDRAAEFLRSR